MNTLRVDPVPPRHPRAWRDVLMVLITVLCGLSGSWLGYRSMLQTEHLRQAERSSAAARDVLARVELELSRTVEAVRSAGLMVQSHVQLPRQSFLRYAELLTAALPPIALVEWQPVVRDAERAGFEQAARDQGLDSFEIREPDASGKSWQPAPTRAFYVPVLYAWPQGNAPLGFNLASDPVRMASKLEAARLGRPMASGSFPIFHQDIGRPAVTGFAITTAVHLAGHAESAEAQGYLAAVIELPTLLSPAGRQAQSAHLDLWVYEGASHAGTPIYASLSQPGRTPAKAGRALALQRINTFTVAGQPWTLLVQPDAAFLSATSHQPEVLLALGLLATALLTGALWRAQQQRREAQLARSGLASERQRLANVVEGTRAAIWELDLTLRQSYVNEHWESLSGYAPGEHLPGPDYDWRSDCHPDDIPRVTEELLRHFRGEIEAFDVEYRHRHKTRGWIWVHSRGKVLKRDPEGRARLMAGTLLDIQARKESESQVLELNRTLEARVAERTAELAQAMESLRESREELAHAEARATLNTLVAGAAHELQTPLGNGVICTQNLVDLAREFGVRLNAGPLRRSELLHFIAQVGENAELAHRNLGRAGTLVGQFRQVAADQASEQRRRFDLGDMLRELLDTLSPSLRRMPHHVHSEVPAGILMDSYPGPLGQVMINLINNACLHAFEPEHAGTVRIQATVQADEVLLSVADDGRGMDAHTLDRLFLPYFSTRIGQGGTGLGMAIVDNLVRKTLGGSLKVLSTPGSGTCIEMRLPLHAPELLK